MKASVIESIYVLYFARLRCNLQYFLFSCTPFFAFNHKIINQAFRAVLSRSIIIKWMGKKHASYTHNMVNIGPPQYF